MAQEELSFKLKFVSEDDRVITKTATTLKEINKSISDMQDQLANTDLGSDTWKEYNKNLEDSKKALDAAEKSSMSLSDKLASIPGPVGAAVQSLKGIGTAVKTIQAAMGPWGLLLTAIVGALGALAKAFFSTKEGADTLKQITAGLNAVMDVFRDVLVKIGKNLVGLFDDPVESLKKFGQLLLDNLINRFTGMLELIPAIGKAIGLLFKGEFAEAGKVAANAVGKVVLGVEDSVGKITEFGKAVGEVVSEAVNEGKRAAALEKQLQKITDAQRELNLERAKQNRVIAEAKNAYTDENKTLEERLEALQKAGKLEQDLADKEANLAQQRYNTIKAINALSDTSDEAKQAEIDAAIAVEQALERSVMKRTELQAQVKTLNDQARAQEKATLEAIDKLRLEFANNAVETERQRLLNEAQLRLDEQVKEIDALKISEEQKTELKLEAQKAYNVKRDQINKDQDAKELQAARDKAMKEFDERLKIEQLNLEASIEGSMEYYDIQRDILDTNLAKELAMYEGNEQAQTSVREKYAKLRNAIDRAELQAKLDAYNAVLGAIAGLAGEETAIGKAAAIAQNAISTYSAASDMFNKVSGAIPPPVGQVLGGIAAAIVVAAGAKQGLKIAGIDTSLPKPKEQKLNAGGMVGGFGAGDSVSTLLTPGESVINARSTSMFGPLLSSINQIGGGARFAGANNEDITARTQVSMMNNLMNSVGGPIKTYVVSTDISSQQEFDRKVVSRSTI